MNTKTLRSGNPAPLIDNFRVTFAVARKVNEYQKSVSGSAFVVEVPFTQEQCWFDDQSNFVSTLANKEIAEKECYYINYGKERPW